MSAHLSPWAREGLSYAAYKAKEERILARAEQIVKGMGLPPLEAVRQAQREIQ